MKANYFMHEVRPKSQLGGGTEPHKRYVIHVLRSTLKSILGEPNLMILEFHLNKRLQGDMYEAFYENPHRFYQALRDFFGSGADAVLRIIAQKLIEGGHLEAASPQEFVEVLKNPGEGGRKLWRMFKLQEAGET